MQLIISAHAKERMQKYDISEVQILDALEKPGNIFDGKKKRKIAQKRINSHVLRVIFEEQTNNKIVITVYKARSERYEI